jgi:DNA-binding IclR family transcriptional regulator
MKNRKEPVRGAAKQSEAQAPILKKHSSAADSGLLSRGLMLLDTLVKQERPLTTSELAEMIGLNSSTTHRLLHNLLQIKYVSRDAAKRYLPTARALLPLGLYHPLNALRRLASEELRDLQHAFRLTTALQIFVGHQRVILEVILGTGSFSPYYETEVTTPIHASSSGKLLLFNLSEEERDQLLGQEPYRGYASATLLTRAELNRDLALIGERGYAVTMNEMLQGLAGVAAPIWLNRERAIGAIVVSGPTRAFEAPMLENIASAAQRSAELFSHASPEIRAVARSLGY